MDKQPNAASSSRRPVVFRPSEPKPPSVKARRGAARSADVANSNWTDRKWLGLVLGGLMMTGGWMFFLSGPGQKTRANDASLIKSLNTSSLSFTVSPNRELEGWTLADVTTSLQRSQWAAPKFPACEATEMLENMLPESYFYLDEFPLCSLPAYPLTSDHKNCSSKYATSVAAVTAASHCVLASKEQLGDSKKKTDSPTVKTKKLSAQELISCDEHNAGCIGGFMDYAIIYVARNGLVTDECMPWAGGREVSCESKCSRGRPLGLTNVCSCKGINAIKRQILESGPVMGTTQVSDAMLLYKSGIYKSTKVERKFTDRSGVLAVPVAIAGWGVSGNVEYWIIGGLFGQTWGDDGFAKVDMHDINIVDQFAVAVYPTVGAQTARTQPGEPQRAAASSSREKAKKQAVDEDSEL